jgi:hypothetical protein
MPKTAKKSASKKAPARSAKTSTTKKAPAKKAASKPPAAARAKSVTATPARLISRKRGGKSEITAVIGSVTNDDIAVRAYFIGERRRHLGLPGDPQSDWLEAERQLRS